MRKLMIGLALSVMATAAQAQWVLVVQSTNGDKLYSDPTTKRRTGNFVRIWQMYEYAKPDAFNGKAYYSYETINNIIVLRERAKSWKAMHFQERWDRVKWLALLASPVL